jgi:hypothetical protein
MSEKTARDGTLLDPKVAADWATVEARRAELNSRDGGDTRRQAILERLRWIHAAGMGKRASST